MHEWYRVFYIERTVGRPSWGIVGATNPEDARDQWGTAYPAEPCHKVVHNGGTEHGYWEASTHLLDDDQPACCPLCGGRTGFVEYGQKQVHQCLNNQCNHVFYGEFDTE